MVRQAHARYKGINTLHPLYCAYGETAEEAMEGIVDLVAGLDEDCDPTDVDDAMELADTDEVKVAPPECEIEDFEVTDVNWPPFWSVR